MNRPTLYAKDFMFEQAIMPHSNVMDLNWMKDAFERLFTLFIYPLSFISKCVSNKADSKLSKLQGIKILHFIKPNLQFARPNSQFARPNSQFARPNSQFARPNSQFARPNSQFARPNSQFARPNSQFQRFLMKKSLLGLIFNVEMSYNQSFISKINFNHI